VTGLIKVFGGVFDFIDFSPDYFALHGIVKQRLQPKNEKRGEIKPQPQPEEPALWSDGEVLNMRPDELEKVTEEKKTEHPIQVKDRVKAEFKYHGELKYYQGTVLKVNPKTFSVLFDDGQKLLMKKHEVQKV
jgi:hypothetical protein